MRSIFQPYRRQKFFRELELYRCPTPNVFREFWEEPILTSAVRKELRSVNAVTGKLGSHLRFVCAPKATEITNAAFFNFRKLIGFNNVDIHDEEHPAIVGVLLT